MNNEPAATTAAGSPLAVRPLAIIAALFLLTPISWLIGIKPWVMQFAAIILFSAVAATGRVAYPRLARYLLAYVAVYVLSFVMNLPAMPLSRAAGSLTNLALWLSGAAMICFVASARRPGGVLWVARSIVLLVCISALITMAGWWLALHGRFHVLLTSPGIRLYPAALLDRSEILRDGLQVLVIRPDVTALGIIPRSAAFFAYPNALAMGSIAALPLAWSPAVIRHRAIRLGASALILIALLGSGSRASIVGLVVAGVMTAVVWSYYRFRRASIIGLSTLCVGITACGVTLGSWHQIWVAAHEYRPGSTRASVFRHALAAYEATDNKVFGMGYKPRPTLRYEPVGSHSTLLGTLVKVGVVGVALLLTIWAQVVRLWWRLARDVAHGHLPARFLLLGASALAGMAWQLVEDLDAPPLAAFAYFFLLGVLVVPSVLGAPAPATTPSE